MYTLSAPEIEVVQRALAHSAHANDFKPDMRARAIERRNLNRALARALSHLPISHRFRSWCGSLSAKLGD